MNDLQELQTFYATDRNVFRRLLLHRFDVGVSKEIVAFWYLLDEKNHFRIMKQRIELMDDSEFNDFAHASIECFKFLQTYSSFYFSTKFKSLLEDVAPNVWEVIRDKEKAIHDIKYYKRNVCDQAFCDIVKLVEAVKLLVQAGACIFPPYTFPTPAEKITNNQLLPKIVVDPDERSLFFTFSKGHAVSGEELETLIRERNFEDRVEEIFPIQPLSVRVVVKTPEDVRRFLGGESSTVTFKINGKDVWVKQWLKKADRS